MKLRQSNSKNDIQCLGYQPQKSYKLNLEVFTMADLRLRGSKEKVRTTHRYEFYSLVCITQGTCTQVVDFKSINCQPGDLLVLQPGQAHNYGNDDDWDGWIVLFRPELILPISTIPRELKLAVNLEKFPEQMNLSKQELQQVKDSIQQMREDSLMDARLDDVNALLRHQLYALLIRLNIFQNRQEKTQELLAPAISQRFFRFQKLVNERFAVWHQVADYAHHLGYTEKSLARAITAATGTTAKMYIASRINLEAKRLLVHTDLPVAIVAEQLGFEAATNFSKFFKRESGCTPTEFRRQQKEYIG